MNEFNLLTAARRHIQDHLDQTNVYFSRHDEMALPCVIIEIDEIWSHNSSTPHDIQSLVKFSLSYLAHETGVQEMICKSKLLGHLLDGHCIKLTENHLAVLRLDTCRTAFGEEDKVKSFNHSYEAIIRVGHES